MQETEVKFRIFNPIKIRKKLKEIGAKKLGKVFENNLVFDNKARELKRKNQLLRLRKDSKITLTFKSAPKGGKFKSREEIEVDVSDFSKMNLILRKAGFFEVFRYEKRRESWKYKNVEIALDKLPFIGYYLELEGQAKDILECANVLEFNMSSCTSKTYRELYEEYCKAKGIKPKDMVFV